MAAKVVPMKRTKEKRVSVYVGRDGSTVSWLDKAKDDAERPFGSVHHYVTTIDTMACYSYPRNDVILPPFGSTFPH